MFNLASAVVQLGRADESVATLRRLLVVQPEARDARSNLLVVMNWSPTSDDEDILGEAVAFGARPPRPQADDRKPHANSRRADRRLRVGYFSADFSTLTPFLPGLFEHHDREIFEVTCYSGASSKDAEVDRMRQRVDRWREVSAVSDAAWMGVPTVSRIGDKVVGRGGLSIARNLGLPDLASETDAAFVATATDLARDLPRLRTLRETLRSRLRASPWMNAQEFARNLERTYRTAFQRWCESDPC